MLPFYLSLIDDDDNKNKFTQLYHEYGNTMLYTALEILRDNQLAEDAVQETLLRLAKNINTIRTDSKSETKAFIITVTRNVAYRIARKNAKYIIMPEENILEEIIPDNVDYESKIIAVHMYEEIKNILQTMDTKYITPLALQEQGYKISEIAKVLNISESAVKMRLSRAKQMIFEKLEDLK